MVRDLVWETYVMLSYEHWGVTLSDWAGRNLGRKLAGSSSITTGSLIAENCEILTKYKGRSTEDRDRGWWVDLFIYESYNMICLLPILTL